MPLLDLAPFADALPPGARLMGLDIGERTVGMAVADGGWTVASPIGTLPRGRKWAPLWADLNAAMTERQVAGLVMGLESPSARAERLAALVSIWGEPLPLTDTIAKIDAVDVGRARQVLKRMASTPPALVLYGPVDRAAGAADVAERLAA